MSKPKPIVKNTLLQPLDHNHVKNNNSFVESVPSLGGRDRCHMHSRSLVSLESPSEIMLQESLQLQQQQSGSTINPEYFYFQPNEARSIASSPTKFDVQLKEMTKNKCLNSRTRR